MVRVPASKSPSQGFTLIEVLVVVVIAAVLVALLLPALSSAKAQAHTTRSLAYIKQLHVGTQSYVDDHRDWLPFLGTPGEPNAPIVLHGYVVPRSFFGAHASHSATLLSPYLERLDAFEVDAIRDDRHDVPSEVIVSRFFFTHTIAAAPSYWNDDEPPLNLGLLSGARWSSMLFPSQKGLITDVSQGAWLASERTDRYPLRNVILVGAGDGAATVRPFPVDGSLFVSRPFGAAPLPVLSTRHGLAGRDF